MPIEIVTAIIAFVGVVASVVASMIVNIRQTNTELQKLRAEIQQTYAGKLLEKRLKVYPALYRLLSDYDKTVRLDAVSRSAVTELLNHVLEWDSENALVVSGLAGRILYEFRKVLIDFTHLPDDEFRDKFGSSTEKRNRIQEANKVELALKSDIGIYVVEFSDAKKSFGSYQEVADVLEKQPTRQSRK